MKEILVKLFEKYFIHKIQEDWKEELKKIPEDRLRKWMDETLIEEVKTACTEIYDDIETNMETKYSYELWMSINDYVNEEADELAKEEEQEEPPDEWDVEDDDNPMEGVMMVCPEKGVGCDDTCDHSVPHTYDEIGCESGCGFTTDHIKCEVHDHSDENVRDTEDQISETQKGLPTPNEIIESGAVCDDR